MPAGPHPQPTIESLSAELATLRQAHTEVLAKRQNDKTRIAELESTVTGLQGKLTENAATIHELTVGGPLKTMAESISPLPELFLEQFAKHFKVEMVNNALTLLSADGKPVSGKDSKPVAFEREALTKFLTDGDDARAKTFKAIVIASRASGAASPNPMPRTAPAKKVQFGLR